LFKIYRKYSGGRDLPASGFDFDTPRQATPQQDAVMQDERAMSRPPSRGSSNHSRDSSQVSLKRTSATITRGNRGPHGHHRSISSSKYPEIDQMRGVDDAVSDLNPVSEYATPISSPPMDGLNSKEQTATFLPIDNDLRGQATFEEVDWFDEQVTKNLSALLREKLSAIQDDEVNILLQSQDQIGELAQMMSNSINSCDSISELMNVYLVELRAHSGLASLSSLTEENR